MILHQKTRNGRFFRAICGLYPIDHAFIGDNV
jgi:hypothetical protein